LGEDGNDLSYSDGDVKIGGDVIPEVNATSSIGSSALRWLKGWFIEVEVETLKVTGDVDVDGDIVVGGYVYSSQCPDDMAYISSSGGYCIDKWEASMPSAN